VYKFILMRMEKREIGAAPIKFPGRGFFRGRSCLGFREPGLRSG
jgi:hypothetical protein